MRGPGSVMRDESVAGKWSQVRTWDEAEGGEIHGVQVYTGDGGEVREHMTAKARLQQLKKSSSKRIMSIKSHLTGIVRKGDKRGTGGAGGLGGGDSEVSSSPMGESNQAGCGPLSSMSTIGGRLKSSKSLQNLEQATRDSLRQVVDKTSYTAASMKHRYGSRLELNKGKYDKFHDDSDNDEENFTPGGF